MVETFQHPINSRCRFELEIELSFHRNSEISLCCRDSVCFLTCLFQAFTICCASQHFALNFFCRISILYIMTALEITALSVMPSMTTTDIVSVWHPPRRSGSLHSKFELIILLHQRKLLTYIHCTFSFIIWAHRGGKFFFELSVWNVLSLIKSFWEALEIQATSKHFYTFIHACICVCILYIHTDTHTLINSHFIRQWKSQWKVDQCSSYLLNAFLQSGEMKRQSGQCEEHLYSTLTADQLFR